MGLAFLLRELQEVEGALHVDLVGGHGRELAPGRQERREVEDELHLELGEDALEQVRVEDRAHELLLHEAADRAVQGLAGRG